ncbi:hypothetical protein RW64_16430 [Geobacter sulfurreducens]|nr:hypothetical protein RW64_16430 [Geobacter sulfurreducens]
MKRESIFGLRITLLKNMVHIHRICFLPLQASPLIGSQMYFWKVLLIGRLPEIQVNGKIIVITFLIRLILILVI